MGELTPPSTSWFTPGSRCSTSSASSHSTPMPKACCHSTSSCSSVACSSLKASLRTPVWRNSGSIPARVNSAANCGNSSRLRIPSCHIGRTSGSTCRNGETTPADAPEGPGSEGPPLQHGAFHAELCELVSDGAGQSPRRPQLPHPVAPAMPPYSSRVLASVVTGPPAVNARPVRVASVKVVCYALRARTLIRLLVVAPVVQPISNQRRPFRHLHRRPALP